MITDGRYASLTISCLQTPMCYKSLVFTVGRPARYVKQSKSNKYPHATGKPDSQYTWFHMGVLEGWLASQLRPCSQAAYLQLFIPRYWSFPQQPIYYTRSEYVGTGRSVTFPTERNLSHFNAFYDLPHYPGYTLTPCSTAVTRQRIQRLLYPPHYPRQITMWQSAVAVRNYAFRQKIVFTCSTRQSE